MPLLIGVGLISCTPSNKKTPGKAESGTKLSDPERNLVVASIGKKNITVGMVADEINRQNPYVKITFNSVERKKVFLKNMVRFEVLAKEAKRQGLDQDPEVIRHVKRAMIDRMMSRARKTLVKPADVTAADVAAHYKKNLKIYKQPPKVRVSQIVLKTRADAVKVMELARKKPTDLKYFASLVRDHSTDSASKVRRGDLGFLTSDSTKAPPEVIKAAFEIDAMWKLAGPVQSADSWVVLMKTGNAEAMERPLEMERGRIKNRLYNTRRLEAMEKFTKELIAKARVKVFDKNLAKVKVKMSGRPKTHSH